jgi:hypothetical protein
VEPVLMAPPGCRREAPAAAGKASPERP